MCGNNVLRGRRLRKVDEKMKSRKRREGFTWLLEIELIEFAERHTQSQAFEYVTACSMSLALVSRITPGLCRQYEDFSKLSKSFSDYYFLGRMSRSSQRIRIAETVRTVELLLSRYCHDSQFFTSRQF